MNLAIAIHGAKAGGGTGACAGPGEQLGALEVELVPPDERRVRNEDLVRAWRERIRMPAGLEGFTITSRRAGPPGRDLTVRLTAAARSSSKRRLWT